MAALRRSRLLLLAVGVALMAVVFFGYQAVSYSGADVVSDSSPQPGWKTIEFHSVRVDIPSGWERWDLDDCEFHFEHWGPPGSSACESGRGVAFYGSATFDPANGPGVRRTETTGGGAWEGYVDVGEYVVYTSDDDRNVVETVLDSARPA